MTATHAVTPVRAAPPAVVLVALGYVTAFVWAMNTRSFDVWGGLLVFPVLAALTMPLIRRLARDDVRLRRLLIGAFVVKLAGSVVRYYLAFDVYGGVADAATYHEAGVALAPHYRVLDFTPDLARELPGTGFVDAVTGVVYGLIGPSKLGGFFVFSWLGFLGLLLLYRAFVIGFPTGDRRRYARLLFFLPSIAFWPSSIGKEAWMTLGLGLVAYGAATLLAGRPSRAALAAGLAATGFVRPHVTLLAFAALAVAYLLRRSRRLPLLGPVGKLVGVLALAGIGVFIVGQVEGFLGVERLDEQSVDAVLDETNERSAQGSSEFTAPDARDVVNLPWATVTVLFRPFPNEAHNGQALATALEGSFLLVLTALSFRRLPALPRDAWRNPYLIFAIAFALLFVIAFSNVANFGIIARQRVQILPFVVALLSVPLPGARAVSEAVGEPALQRR